MFLDIVIKHQLHSTKMKTKNLPWIAACFIFFILGVSIGRQFFIQTITFNKNNQKQSTTAFNIPQIPIPPQDSLPGNSFDSAFILNPGIKTQGTLNTNNAIDYYTFDLKDPSQIVVDITDVPKALFWILYDSSQKEIASSYRSGTLGGSTQIALNNPGKYYIKVWADYHELVNYPYTIRLSILPYFE